MSRFLEGRVLRCGENVGLVFTTHVTTEWLSASWNVTLRVGGAKPLAHLANEGLDGLHVDAVPAPKIPDYALFVSPVLADVLDEQEVIVALGTHGS